MVWRLIASVLVVTETGGVSVTDHHHDWPDEPTCLAVIQKNYTVPPGQQQVGNTKLDIRIRASCFPLRMEYVR